MSECICEFDPSCGGEGYLRCLGCGGDLCVCGACNGNGEAECPGCLDCTIDHEALDAVWGEE